jgi:hypothetical protein
MKKALVMFSIFLFLLLVSYYYLPAYSMTELYQKNSRKSSGRFTTHSRLLLPENRLWRLREEHNNLQDSIQLLDNEDKPRKNQRTHKLR